MNDAIHAIFYIDLVRNIVRSIVSKQILRIKKHLKSEYLLRDFASISQSHRTCTFAKKRWSLTGTTYRIVECFRRNGRPRDMLGIIIQSIASRFPFLFFGTATDSHSELAINLNLKLKLCHKRIGSALFCVNQIALCDHYVNDSIIQIGN